LIARGILDRSSSGYGGFMLGSHFTRLLILAIIVAVAFYIVKPAVLSGHVGKANGIARAQPLKNHVIDKAGVIPPQDVPRFEQYMGWIMRESGVDVRFVFLPDTSGQSIESLAVDMMDKLQIGGRTGQERGVLLLYDMQGQRLKVEVGYGLEGWFPDAFVNYLVQDHARMFFSSGDISLGLRLMLRLLQHRIREAVIGNDFDPRVLNIVQPLSHMSGGAGVSTAIGLRDGANAAPQVVATNPMDFPAGDSPAEAYARYLDWLSRWPTSPQIELFTAASRGYLSSMHISPAYAEFILLAEYGKRYEVVERGDLALLYFTGTPFVSPHFFERRDGHWRMDIAAEVRDTHEHVGGEYTWAYYGKDDNYTRSFGDLLATLKGYRRLRDGDNRELVIRGSY
jgi:uncharacterized protein